MKLKKTAFAGSWYPGTATECDDAIKGFTAKNQVNDALSERQYFAAIVPHAGWYFSGGIACRAIQALADNKTDIVFLFGGHMAPGDPISIVSDGAMETPLGNIDIDGETSALLADRLSCATVSTDALPPDNTIELQLPFIRHFFGENIKLVVINAPPNKASITAGAMVLEVCNQCKMVPKVIGSTDLTHYGPNFGFYPKGQGPAAVDWVKQTNDRQFINRAIRLESSRLIEEALVHRNACCSGAAAAVVSAAAAKGLDAGILTEYATSYDKNPSDSFVGYAGILY